MQIQILDFNQLSIQQLYAILQLRSEVFVVEQDCVYQDIDGHDQKAQHVLFFNNDILAAYARILPPKAYFKELSIGRVIVKESFRGQKLGHQLMQTCIKFCQENYTNQPIKISAQQYLIKFYEHHHFTAFGKGYLEDGIPHIAMKRDV
ncbi:MAG: GNAT family N-acetyltransferase [Psychroflexus salarius]